MSVDAVNLSFGFSPAGLPAIWAQQAHDTITAPEPPLLSLQRHTKFSEVADLQPLLYSRQLQMGEAKKAEHTTLGDAVSCGVIANETLGYFIGRTHLFLLRVGINPKRMRFRWAWMPAAELMH